MEKGYFERTYAGPFKGINSALPENMIDPSYSPSFSNIILKNGELRTRPRQLQGIPGPQGGQPLTVLTSFLDANGVVHTVTITSQGLYQLNPAWRSNLKKAWNLIAPFQIQPGPSVPVSHCTFLNKFFWTNGGINLWYWDGISNGFNSVGPVNTVTGPPIVNTTAGAYFLGELGGSLVLLSTVEGTGLNVSTFPQRVRWSPSGLPFTWDPNVNIGAGFNDEIDVPDAITGFLTVGRTGFIFRVNGITEISLTGSGTNPFDFNHLWASDRGIGNIYPFSIAGYGPIGMFISNEDVYLLSLGGFKQVGGVARDSIMNDLAAATSTPVATIFPYYQRNYVYMTYFLTIPIGLNSVVWRYSQEDQSWQRDFKLKGIYTGRARYIQTS